MNEKTIAKAYLWTLLGAAIVGLHILFFVVKEWEGVLVLWAIFLDALIVVAFSILTACAIETALKPNSDE